MNSIITLAMDEIVLLVFLYKSGFGIKPPTKVDMPLKAKKPNYYFDQNIGSVLFSAMNIYIATLHCL